jgi:uncharacterized protein (TIGR02145 family)
LKIYPNPMTDFSTLEIFPPFAGKAVISVTDMTGRQLAQIESYLEKSNQNFKLTGLKNGFYLATVTGNNYQFSVKVLSNGRSNGTIKIEKVDYIVTETEDKQEKSGVKGIQATIDMTYTTGDRLKFTGISGIYSTIITDKPISDKIIYFSFMSCTDGDNINYPIVTIGTQTWMAENLRTTKYNDNTAIPLITGGPEWAALTTPAFCWYNNDAGSYKDSYGALYNWNAVNAASSGGKNVCPTGWHVPTDAQWTTLSTFLGGESASGGKLKEKGNVHWVTPNVAATDETGFSALPGGSRGDTGTFTLIGSLGNLWTATQSDASYSRMRLLSSSNSKLDGNYIAARNNGLTIRCLAD